MHMIEPVNVRYGKGYVLKNVTLKSDKARIYCLPGRNEAGKIRLLKFAAGFRNIIDGKVITTAILDTG